MSFYNPTKNPFPFYKLEGEVWTNKKPLWFSNNCNYQFQKYPIFPGKRHFQLRVSDNIVNQTDNITVNLRRVSNNTIVGATINKTLFTLQKPERKFVTIAIDIPTGYVNDQFYISVETDYGFYYSETFCVKNPNNFVGIIWSSSNGRVGELIYPSGYVNNINIDAEIIPLEPQLEEETIENGFGQETPTMQILKQGFRFSFLAPNFMAQAFSALPMHDRIQIVNRKKYDYDEDFDEDIKDVTAKVTPEEDGCFSFVEISYVEETIIDTSCIEEIVPANNPPLADIVWGDTQTTEDRTCNDLNDCNTSLLATENTYDPDGNLDYMEWEKSADDGGTWIKIGDATVGVPFAISENTEDIFWYRLKAVDTYNAIGYSNILKYNLDNSPYFTNVFYLSTGESLDAVRFFDIIGDPGQNVRINAEVLSTYGRGFSLAVKNRITSAVVGGMSNGWAGTNSNHYLTLDGAGVGKFSATLLLQECNGSTSYQSTEIGLRLYKNDNITLGSGSITVKKYISCT